VFIPRVPLIPLDITFQFRGLQLPLLPAFAMPNRKGRPFKFHEVISKVTVAVMDSFMQRVPTVEVQSSCTYVPLHNVPRM
jgi:hypothetical protein